MKNFRKRLTYIISNEVKMLPDQSPLEFFVHHNNLHAFENINFEDAVENCFYEYGKSPYMPLDFYRNKIHNEEIKFDYFSDNLLLNGFDVNEDLKKFIFKELFTFFDDEQIRFYKNESMRMDFKTNNWLQMDPQQIFLWQKIDNFDFNTCSIEFKDFHVNRLPNRTSNFLVPFLSSMLDQGQADLNLSKHQRQNVWPSFLAYLNSSFNSKIIDKYMKMIPANIESVLDLIESRLVGLDDDSLLKIIRTELNMLPGWAGMIYKTSRNKEVIPRREVFLKIEDYLLMRLILNDIFRITPEINSYEVSPTVVIKENIFNFLLNQKNNEYEISYLFELFEKLSPIVLRRILQQSFEQTYQYKILKGISNNKNSINSTIKYQMFFCIDDRESSFRRYLEEISHGCVSTFGVAGFFGLDMMYQKYDEPYPRRFCPPLSNPKYLIKEKGIVKKYKFARFLHYGHANFIRSITSSFMLTPLNALSFKFHLYAPRLKRRILEERRYSKIENIIYKNTSDNIETNRAYEIEELALRVATILKGAGVTKNFAPYVLMIGHGHDSFNNPHVAAYRCGACSGANGYPNARVFTQAANDPNVRLVLKEKHGIFISNDSYFMAGYHDTCSDKVELFDIDRTRIPFLEQEKLEQLLLKVRRLNAQERCKKFFQAPKNISPINALRFIEERSWRIAEPRPELNHATNSLCIVGRRNLTSNLFLDRRAFLVSYDNAIDKDNSILKNLLAAVIPVCSGINLEYYFSKVDTENYGSGSKTSHNVTSLLGVINGIRGDLRTGLVWQMVEYHDPLRILFVIEAFQDQVEMIITENEQVKNLITNNWIKVAIINPKDSSDISIYKNDKFEKTDLQEINIITYENSMQVPTGLIKPVDIAYLKGKNDGKNIY